MTWQPMKELTDTVLPILGARNPLVVFASKDSGRMTAAHFSIHTGWVSGDTGSCITTKNFTHFLVIPERPPHNIKDLEDK